MQTDVRKKTNHKSVCKYDDTIAVGNIFRTLNILTMQVLQKVGL